MKKHTIWGNVDIDLSDWAEYLKEYEENYLEEDEEMTDDLKYQLITDLNNEYLDDERSNLDIRLDNPILVIADLGLWNGRKSAYKIINSCNIKDILYDNADFVEWYSDGYNIRCEAHHHDGVNHYEYREIKNMNTIDKLTNMLYNQYEVDRKIINQYTRSIEKHVRRVYGW